MRGLYWLRSDLRLHDNPALLRWAEASTSGQVLWCPSRSHRRAGCFRSSFLWASLAAFASDLRGHGAEVQIEDSDIREALPKLLEQQTFDCIFFSEEPCSEERADEAWVRSLGIPCESFASRPLLRQADLPFAVRDLPEVFTHFRKQVEACLAIPPPLPVPQRLPRPASRGTNPGLSLESIMARCTHPHPEFPGGEQAGCERLRTYVWELDRLRTYKETRDGLLDWNASSKLSPWLAVGSLSARRIYAEIRRYEEERVRNESTYWLFFELLWRDYFYWIALKWGTRLFTGMSRSSDGPADPSVFERWKQGQSGSTFVDAHMNELRLTGWMSNRGRQNVANYLVKTLGYNWRAGASYFEHQLIDYDPTSNWGNWAYQAGVGQDPRQRRFNPEHQAQLYDPQGDYVRLWVKGG